MSAIPDTDIKELLTDNSEKDEKAEFQRDKGI